MRISRVALGLAVAAPASALLVGCGGGTSDNETYGDSFTAVAQPLTTALVDLGNAVGVATSRKQIAAALGRTEEALQTASEDFNALDPPEDAAEIQDTLISALGKFEQKVEQARDVARDGSDGEFQAAIADFNAESQSFAAALAEIGQQLDNAGIQLGEPTIDPAG